MNTDEPTPASPSRGRSDSYAALLQREDRRAARKAECFPTNKSAVFDRLAAAGLLTVSIAFDGYGDEGQIESVDARDAHGEAALPEGDVVLASPTGDGDDIVRRKLGLREAIEQLAYDLLHRAHPGWENNEGAYGEFTLNVAQRTIGLEHNERFIESTLTEHEW